MSKSVGVLKSIKLNNGLTMPTIGLGTFQGTYDYASGHETVVNAISSAIDVGFRMIDTATLYGTEKAVGDGIKKKIEEGKVKRDDLYIVTKLWSNGHRRDEVVPCLRESLKNLSLDFVDMFLIHWPFAIKRSGDELMPKDEDGKIIFDDEHDFLETWKGMIECRDLGLTRSIGVSNFNVRQLQRIVDNSSEVPANQQIEVNPFFPNTKLIEFCQKHNIVVSCFSPLGKPGRPWKKEDDPFVTTDPTLNAIGKVHNKTAMQIGLRFLIQRGLVPIPKSNSFDHLKENIDVYDFELSDDEMSAIFENCCSLNFRVLDLKHMFGHAKEYPFKED